MIDVQLLEREPDDVRAHIGLKYGPTITNDHQIMRSLATPCVELEAKVPFATVSTQRPDQVVALHPLAPAQSSHKNVRPATANCDARAWGITRGFRVRS